MAVFNRWRCIKNERIHRWILGARSHGIGLVVKSKIQTRVIERPRWGNEVLNKFLRSAGLHHPSSLSHVFDMFLEFRIVRSARIHYLAHWRKLASLGAFSLSVDGQDAGKSSIPAQAVTPKRMICLSSRDFAALFCDLSELKRERVRKWFLSLLHFPAFFFVLSFCFRHGLADRQIRIAILSSLLNEKWRHFLQERRHFSLRLRARGEFRARNPPRAWWRSWPGTPTLCRSAIPYWILFHLGSCQEWETR